MEWAERKLLWKFDANPKDSVFSMRNATRLHPIGTPVINGDRVFIALGEDPNMEKGQVSCGPLTVQNGATLAQRS